MGKTNFTKQITGSREFTVNVAENEQFTINVCDCKRFTINISDCQNYTINEEDVRKEEQGKLWKLWKPPCEPGQPVWKIKNGKIQKWVVDTIKIEGSGVSFCNVVYICDISDFGKTVFFTREEAEAALKALEEQNNAI